MSVPPVIERPAIMALSSCVRSLATLDSLARSCIPLYPAIEAAARIAITTMTIRSSTIVKPSRVVLLMLFISSSIGGGRGADVKVFSTAHFKYGF